MQLLHIIRAPCCYTSHPDGVSNHDKRSHIQAKITKPAPHTLSDMSCRCDDNESIEEESDDVDKNEEYDADGRKRGGKGMTAADISGGSPAANTRGGMEKKMKMKK